MTTDPAWALGHQTTNHVLVAETVATLPAPPPWPQN